MSTPSIPKGTRDFTPDEMLRRNYIFNTIREVFVLFGYQPIETPSLENLSTLLGKYGDEGDKLLFKVLNSGDFMASVPAGTDSSAAILKYISEKGLRYDLTVPFARFVVQHRNEIVFPFKRYQIQPVWRADRPQKGRYREFYQCDVDVVGSDSLLNEVEMVRIADAIFKKLKINVVIKLNNRKILSGIAEWINAPEQITDITVAIDKMDKIGLDGVKLELLEKGLTAAAIEKLIPVLHLSGTNEEKIESLKVILADSEVAQKGIEELTTVFNYLRLVNLTNTIEFDLTLARGLSYYTGAIIEIKAKDFSIGSISGGGRYDNLTGIFGMPGVSGVGISFGADRIYDVLHGLNRFPAEDMDSVKVMLANFGGEEEKVSLQMLEKLQTNSISAELYPEAAKLKKQFAYADNRNIPYTIVIGSDEIVQQKYQLKNMKSGEQSVYSPNEIIEILSK
jgi:histidyl-tRNA synthetase